MSGSERPLRSPLERAARAWWRGHRPVSWTEAEHLKNPTINSNGFEEKRLMREVARLVASDK